MRKVYEKIIYVRSANFAKKSTLFLEAKGNASKNNARSRIYPRVGKHSAYINRTCYITRKETCKIKYRAHKNFPSTTKCEKLKS